MSNPLRSYITTLTPLRGIAALLVVVFHCNLMVTTFLPPGYTSIISMGWIWVDFFFVLSGFILAYVYSQDFKYKFSKSNYWNYIKARFARIYPLHFFTLILALAGVLIVRSFADGLDPFFADMLDPMAAPASLLLLQGMNFYSAAPLNTPSWSLSTEWWMYMVFPFFVPFFSKTKLTGKVFIFFLIAGSYWLIMYYLGPIAAPFPGGPPTINVVADYGFLRCAAGFFLGMLTYEFYSSGSTKRIFESDLIFVVLSLGCLIGMHYAIHELLIVLFFPFLILAAAYNESRVKKILDLRPLQRLGDWSFSIYMVHVPIIYIFWIIDVKHNPKYFADFMTLVQTPPDYALGLVRLLIIVPATLVTAALTYYYIEIPTRNYINGRFKTNKSFVPAKA
jgi:peptidoglycan/LPS O-acetylase OafA/YrhL